MEGEIILSEIIQTQKVKNHSLSYADCKPKTNAVILLDVGHA
jgi:hypothetical protein